MRKKIVVLGASGSVGSQTVDVLLQHEDLFEIYGLSVGCKWQYLDGYLSNHSLTYGCVRYEKDFLVLSKKYPETKFFWGDEGLIEMSKLENCDLLFNGLQGFVGLMPTITAIQNNIDVALANKESLVAGGNIVMDLANKNNVRVIPVDSEHSAIFQCLNGNRKEDIKRLVITASGGAFKNKSREELVNVTLKDALKHPNWHMGAKITIDSATMMNKGFEVIEAHMLFNLPYDQIDVITHPESIVHSMVEYNDHSVIAQMGVADMRLPIQYALTYPDRLTNSSESLSLAQIGSLHFKEMDYQRFPLLKLAYEVARKDGNLPAVMNGANEKAVDLFISGEIGFLDIETLIFKTVETADSIYKENPDIDDIIFANKWAEEKVLQLAKEL